VAPPPPQVHRGAYTAAEALYERFVPLVYEHLESSPLAKVCFTVSGRRGGWLEAGGGRSPLPGGTAR
jgi:hypothetical protein